MIHLPEIFTGSNWDMAPYCPFIPLHQSPHPCVHKTNKGSSLSYFKSTESELGKFPKVIYGACNIVGKDCIKHKTSMPLWNWSLTCKDRGRNGKYSSCRRTFSIVVFWKDPMQYESSVISGINATSLNFQPSGLTVHETGQPPSQGKALRTRSGCEFQ